jgi:membrane fusion protein (multidrug efflux system)
VASSFNHTLRSLETKQRWGLWLIPGFLLVAAWITWMLLAQVSVYASAPRARIEVSHVPSRVASESGGRIIYLAVELGASVERGELLLELDATVQKSQLAQQFAELATQDAKRSGVEAQLGAERAKRRSRQRLGELAGERATLGLQQARVVAAHRQELARIAEELQREQLNSIIDAVNADGNLRESRVAVADATTEIARVSAEHEYEDKVDLARIAELERQLIDLDAERTTTQAAMDTARAQLTRLCIYAPASGRLGQIAPLQVGDIIEPGQVIATIIPADDVRLVAHFPPGPAVGRILPGQLARLRLDGFSWMEFGMVEASVAVAANEPHDGLIRVELTLHDPGRLGIPMQHGLTGSVDIRIERTSPWTLLERSVGAGMTEPGPVDHVDAAARIARESTP